MRSQDTRPRFQERKRMKQRERKRERVHRDKFQPIHLALQAADGCGQRRDAVLQRMLVGLQRVNLLLCSMESRRAPGFPWKCQVLGNEKLLAVTKSLKQYIKQFNSFLDRLIDPPIERQEKLNQNILAAVWSIRNSRVKMHKKKNDDDERNDCKTHLSVDSIRRLFSCSSAFFACRVLCMFSFMSSYPNVFSRSSSTCVFSRAETP